MDDHEMIVVHQNRAFSTSSEQDKQSDLEEEEVHVPYEILSESEEEGDVTDSEKDDECDEDCESFYPSDLMSFAWQIARGMVSDSLRKRPTFLDATTGLPAKWRLRNECRNSRLMTRHYPDLGSASDWLKQISRAARPIRSSIQIWVVTRHQYGISALVSQTSFLGETSGGVAKCRLFSQVTCG